METNTMTKAPVSVCILSKNDERRIGACLEAVSWADDVIVVDNFSTDRTAEIARRHTERVIQREWPGFARQREFAAGQARHDWALCLDADEIVSAELGAAIRQAVTGDDGAHDGFRLRRVNCYMGRTLRFGGQTQDRLRLVRRCRATFVGEDFHDEIAVPGRVGRLRGALLHPSFESLQDQLARTELYSDLAVKEMLARGERRALLKMLTHPPGMFVRNYVLRGGFLDGIPGLVWAGMNAFYVFVKYAKLFDALRRKKGP